MQTCHWVVLGIKLLAASSCCLGDVLYACCRLLAVFVFSATTSMLAGTNHARTSIVTQPSCCDCISYHFIVLSLQPHQDGPLYQPVVCILSLGSPAVLRFWRKQPEGEPAL
eukprot:GHRR01028939.1.p2 GENE.GHRR01028939.1~~GHRR01028939.1.p2  ORF type:complete len:111 (+),score=17.63 GHRR01028939.1:1298-1630(+)